MELHEELSQFYLSRLPDGVLEGKLLKAPCPFCGRDSEGAAGRLVVYLSGHSFFTGYFRCLNRCVPGGFAPHFGRLLGLDPSLVPDYDPDRRPHPMPKELPAQGINQEINRLHGTLTPEIRQYFAESGIGPDTLRELKIGFNGRYLVYPYFRENDRCYAAHCLSPDRGGDHFWLGDSRFAADGLQIFNLKDIDRCEDGALFVTEGEANLLCLRELGYPGVAAPGLDDLAALDAERFAYVKTVFLVMRHSPEAEAAARAFAERLGFKARLLQWPATRERDFDLTRLAREDLAGFKAAVAGMINSARAYSPFRPPSREYQLFRADLEHRKTESYQAMRTGLQCFDRAMGGVHGLNVIGG
ncbi:MAG: DNA helicase, partial [Desulfurivibrionaceae bacterium]